MDKYVDKMEIDVMNYVINSGCLDGLINIKNIYPVFSPTPNQTSLTYNFNLIKSENSYSQSLLKLKVITKDYDKAKLIEKNILKVLNMKNKIFVSEGNTYFYSVASGGGLLINPEYGVFESTLNFTIKWRDK